VEVLSVEEAEPFLAYNIMRTSDEEL